MKITASIAPAVVACAILSSQCTPYSASAQTLAFPQTHATVTSWNAANEVVVSVSVATVLLGHTAGTPAGLNLHVSSTRGDLYANLGTHLGSALTKQLTSGQFLTLTGMISTFNGDSYLLVRTLNLNGQTFIVRNAHGIPVNSVTNGVQSSRIHQGSFGGAR